MFQQFDDWFNLDAWNFLLNPIGTKEVQNFSLCCFVILKDLISKLVFYASVWLLAIGSIILHALHLCICAFVQSYLCLAVFISVHLWCLTCSSNIFMCQLKPWSLVLFLLVLYFECVGYLCFSVLFFLPKFRMQPFVISFCFLCSVMNSIDDEFIPCKSPAICHEPGPARGKRRLVISICIWSTFYGLQSKKKDSRYVFLSFWVITSICLQARQIN